MKNLKISLITVCYNAGLTIKRTIESVIGQNFQNLEYIIIDGGSTDCTMQVIERFKDHISVLVSEPDQGIYDAMNKGIMLSSGEVIGMLNADDYFAHNMVLSDVAFAFGQEQANIVYGDMDFVNKKGNIIRKWRSGKYSPGIFNWGWMPPHPTFYCKKILFERFGLYSLEYGTAADYELMLRFIHCNNLNIFYLAKVIVKMQTGGASNKTAGSRIKALISDFKAMKKNKIKIPIITILFKPLRKVGQYFSLPHKL